MQVPHLLVGEVGQRVRGVRWRERPRPGTAGDDLLSPFAHLDQYVVSTTLPASPDPRVHVVAGDPVELVRRLKHRPGAGVWLAGGARLAGALLGEIDELVIKRYGTPVGLPLTRQPYRTCDPGQVA
jgi:dihydrofolate reductase